MVNAENLKMWENVIDMFLSLFPATEALLHHTWLWKN